MSGSHPDYPGRYNQQRHNNPRRAVADPHSDVRDLHIDQRDRLQAAFQSLFREVQDVMQYDPHQVYPFIQFLASQHSTQYQTMVTGGDPPLPLQTATAGPVAVHNMRQEAARNHLHSNQDIGQNAGTINPQVLLDQRVYTGGSLDQPDKLLMGYERDEEEVRNQVSNIDNVLGPADAYPPVQHYVQGFNNSQRRRWGDGVEPVPDLAYSGDTQSSVGPFSALYTGHDLSSTGMIREDRFLDPSLQDSLHSIEYSDPGGITGFNNMGPPSPPSQRAPNNRFKKAKTTTSVETQSVAGSDRTCGVCHRSFPFPRDLSAHVRSKHDGGLQCRMCNQRLSCPYSLQRHIAAKHRQGHLCETCGQPFGNKMALKKHQVREHSQGDACDRCGEKVSELSKHLADKHQVGPVCTSCNRHFPSIHSLRNHKKKCEDPMNQSPGPSDHRRRHGDDHGQGDRGGNQPQNPQYT